MGAPSAREKDYIGAVQAFFAGSGDYSSRALAFEKAMEGVHQRNPQDREAAIFYALALLGNAPPTDKTYARQKQAAALLNAVLPQAPDHPGVAHYVIHSFDYPALAELALPAARAYSKIAPSAPHALHMPSHIFTRLGLWDESIESNLASAAAARAWVARAHPGLTAFDSSTRTCRPAATARPRACWTRSRACRPSTSRSSRPPTRWPPSPCATRWSCAAGRRPWPCRCARPASPGTDS
jgi:hypothetical protein